jgi:hypothetical protein
MALSGCEFTSVHLDNRYLHVSHQYIAFVWWLTLRSQKKLAGDEAIPVTSQVETQATNDGPPKKRRKTLKRVKVTKTSFDTAPHKMHDDAPRSMKGTQPFKHMVNAKWLFEHPEFEPQLLPGADWLNGFFSRLGEKDLLVEDLAYLKEVEEWRKKLAVAVASGGKENEQVTGAEVSGERGDEQATGAEASGEKGDEQVVAVATTA